MVLIIPFLTNTIAIYPKNKSVKYGIIAKQIYKSIGWRKTPESLSIDYKVGVLIETLLNIFWNHIPNKIIKFNCCWRLWMTDSI